MRRWMVPLIVVVVAAMVGSLVTVVVFGGDDSASATVTLEPVNTTGADPFTDSVAIRETADFPDSVDAVSARLETDAETGGLAAPGATPGLYGGTRDEAVCDPDQLVTFLDRNPDKAAAWAAVLGIRAEDIGSYVAKLIPVVLTTDTRVTNHGYKDGKATTLNSVLQAGTAVLVDARGVPRVKCGCGNPLTEPTPTAAAPAGNPWPGYQPDRVATVIPAPRPVTDFTLTDIETGDTYEQPAGTGDGTGGGGKGTAIRDVDLLNRTYAPDPASSSDGCLGDTAITLTNGTWQNVQDLYTEEITSNVTYLDIDGDGTEEAIVSLQYYPGGNVFCRAHVFFELDDGEAVEVGRVSVGESPDIPPSLDDGQEGRIVIWENRPTAADPHCCPSQFARRVYQYRDGVITFATETLHTEDQLDALREPG